MKLFFRYIYLCRRTAFVYLAFVLIFFVSFKLYGIPMKAVIYPALLCLLFGILVFLMSFVKVRRRHAELMRIKSIGDIIDCNLGECCGINEEDIKLVAELICEEHAKYRTETEKKYSDMVDYYTVWVHQIKTPIASMRLTLQNEESALSRVLMSDLMRIEQYVDMVLTFLRLDSDSTDYVFKEYELDRIVRNAVRKFSSEFITRKLTLSYDTINTNVVTDEKWLSFVIEQVLSNALKYTHSGGISITLVGNATLCIRDTGIGIAAEDMPRIFENGYTGYNGRQDKRASGIGLYLCRRICDKLGYKISAESFLDEGTAVYIDLSRENIEFE